MCIFNRTVDTNACHFTVDGGCAAAAVKPQPDFTSEFVIAEQVENKWKPWKTNDL